MSLSDNVEVDTAVVANGAVIAAFGSRSDFPSIPFWPLLFANVTLRLLGSDDFPRSAKELAAQQITSAAASGALRVQVAGHYALENIAAAHDRVDEGVRGRVLLTVPTD
ncbi:hypothetical protein [Mycolicibacterium sp. P9-64]|uniref:hypothetical protein n=1 Tax=Mycolicibacterium sp. P9-64 TaxID=2024612 RepID=UPI0018D5BCE9|nr:hypothetical protein [Mycolicibacterium sp. P9-64]